VAWTRFQWRVLRTAHFEVVFYPEEEDAATVEARRAEQWHERLAALFGLAPRGRATIILYANQSDYQKTIATPQRLGRVVGGPVEPVGDRLVVPLSGDPQRDEYLLGHQVAHLFESEVQHQRRRRQPLRSIAGWPPVPEWMTEGLAEYLARGRDSALTAMWLRDALARGDLPSLGRLARLRPHAAYPWGQAFWAYVGGRWSDPTVVQLYTRITQVGVAAALRQVLGLTAREIDLDWRTAIAAAYGPFVAAHGAPGGPGPGRVGERLVPRHGASRDEDLAPAVSPDGSRVAFLSTRGLFGVDLYLADAHTGKVLSRLLSTASSAHFEALRYLDSAAAWSPDGSRVALVEFARGADRIAILDAADGRVERQVDVPGVGAIANPAWSPDGGRIALVGITGGMANLYVLDLGTGRVRKLTGDGHSDLQPAWSPDGQTLAFSSDRDDGDEAPAGGHARRRIWLLDVATAPGGTPRQAMPLAVAGTGAGEGDQINPCFGPDGRQLYFLSDRGGVSDVYRLDLAASRLFQVTHAVTGVSGTTRLSPALSVAARSGRILFSVFADSTFEIHALEPAAEGGAGDLVAAAGRQAVDDSAAVDGSGASTTASGAGGASDAGALTGRLSLLPPIPAARPSAISAYLAGRADPPAADAAAEPVAASPAVTGNAGQAPAAAAKGEPAAGAAAGAPGPGAEASAPGAAAGAGAPGTGTGAGTVVAYRPALALESISPDLGVAYSSLGYAIGGDISAQLGDAVDRYQLRADLQGGASAFPEYGGQVSFLDQAGRLQWGASVGYVPSVSGFSRVTETSPVAPPAGAAGGRPVPEVTIDQIFELVDQRQVSWLLQYPFSATWRLQGSLSYSRLAFSAKDVRQALAASQVVSTTRFDLPPPGPLSLVQGSLALVGDSAVLGLVSPVRGQRYRLEVAWTGGDLRFEQITADYRRYFFFRPLTLAVRGLHLGRYGSDADSDRLIPLYIGDATLVRGYDLGSLSATECTPTPRNPTSCPEFDRLVGSRLAVANVELRLPLLGKDNVGVFEFRYLPTEIAVFLDAGSAWSANAPPELRLATSSAGRLPVASTGVAARFLIAGVAVGQLYVAKPFQRPERGAVTGIVISPGW
jgi:hypothetical protein